MTDPLAQAEAALEQALDAVHTAENVSLPSGAGSRESLMTESAAEPSAVAALVEAHLAKSATPPKPRFLDMGKGYLGPTAINGT